MKIGDIGETRFEKGIVVTKLTAREKNILQSPKRNGSCEVDSIPYLREMGIEIADNHFPIQFTSNRAEIVHRWSPYIQGFSSVFVQYVIDKYRSTYKDPTILDPFAGSGTALVQAKVNRIRSAGTELNPLLQFLAETKLNSWHVSPRALVDTFDQLPKNCRKSAPEFLKSDKHFTPPVLCNLELLRGAIDTLPDKNDHQRCLKDLMRLAFASILVDVSNLKRTPCLGYDRKKRVADDAPWTLMQAKVFQIAKDLSMLQNRFPWTLDTPSDIVHANAMTYDHQIPFDLVITSPPYMNGLDYVMNYKIEMAWLGFVTSMKELKSIKDDMVVCDNVSRGLINDFASSDEKYTNDWLEQIKDEISRNIARRGSYRRPDMPNIVQKYFDDMYRVMRHVAKSIRPGGRFLLVVGDSLIADTYVPTDLILARIGMEPEIGLELESIEKARGRASGQVRSYRLRETIVTLLKP